VLRRHFPIHHPLFPDETEQVRYKLIRVIPWELIEQHEAQALKNHKRTIESLPGSSVDYAPARPSPSWKTGPSHRH
jgi:hypothetical protein